MPFLKALPALLVLILFPLVVVALLLGVIALMILIAVKVPGSLVTYLGLTLIVGLVGGLIYAGKELSGTVPSTIDGPALSHEDAPGLWAMIGELAAGVGTRTVDVVVVTTDVNAAVTKVGGRRVVFIGLPLLACLDQAELRAVLAHELGHYAGGRFALASALLRTQRAFVAVAGNASGAWGYVFRACARLYVAAARWSCRDVERAADSFSVQLAGSGPTASSFRRMEAVEIAWGILGEEYLPYFRIAGARAGLVEGIRGMVDAHEEELLDAADHNIAAQRPRWNDSHPLIRDRIARALASHWASVEGGEAPAMALVPRGLGPAERDLLVMGDAQLTGWDEVMVAGLTDQMHELAREIYGRLLAAGTIKTPTARAVLDAQRCAPVGATLTDDPAELEDATMSVLEMVCRDALLSANAISPIPAWGGLVKFREADGPFEITSVIGQAGPAPVDEIIAELQRRGAQLDETVPLSRPQRPEVRDDDLLAAVTNCYMHQAGRAVDLWLFPSGLLLLRSRANGLKLMAGAARKDRQVDRLTSRLAENGLDRLKSAKGSTWVPREDVEEINVRPTALRVRVRGRGKEYRLKHELYTAVLGELEPNLALLYPGLGTIGRKRIPIPEPGSAASEG